MCRILELTKELPSNFDDLVTDLSAVSPNSHSGSGAIQFVEIHWSRVAVKPRRTCFRHKFKNERGWRVKR